MCRAVSLIDIDECAESAPCSENADCFDTEGSFSCQCRPGFSGDGLNCTRELIIDLSFLFDMFNHCM